MPHIDLATQGAYGETLRDGRDRENRSAYLHPVVQNARAAAGLAVGCTERAVSPEEQAIVDSVGAPLTLLAHM